jgi:tight adherence protein B
VTIAVVILVGAAFVLVAAWASRRIVPARSFFIASGSRAVSSPRHGRWRRPPRVDDDDVAEWCAQVARSVRAGSSLAHAVVQAGATTSAGAAPFQPVVHALTRGRGLADALTETAIADDPTSAAGLVVPVLNACAELGGPAAMPLDRVAATLHARSAERADRKVNSAQARLSAQVLSTVPLGVLVLLALAEPAVRSTLISPVGVVCVVVGGLFNLAGWCWMRHLICGAE